MRKRSLYGWTELVCGVLLLLLALSVFIYPDVIIAGNALSFAIVAIVCGVADFFFSYLYEPAAGAITARIGGFAAIVLGVLAATGVGPAGLAMRVLIPAWFVTHSTIRLVNARFILSTGGRAACGCTVVAGLLGFVLAILLMIGPLVPGGALSYAMAGYLALTGVSSLFTALSGTGHRHISLRRMAY